MKKNIDASRLIFMAQQHRTCGYPTSWGRYGQDVPEPIPTTTIVLLIVNFFTPLTQQCPTGCRHNRGSSLGRVARTRCHLPRVQPSQHPCSCSWKTVETGWILLALQTRKTAPCTRLSPRPVVVKRVASGNREPGMRQNS